MPDLPSRYAEEAAIASVIRPLFERLRDDAIRHPDSIQWEEFRIKASEELAAKLAGIYLLAAANMQPMTKAYHPDESTVSGMAMQYAQSRAGEVISGMVDNLKFDVGSARSESITSLVRGSTQEQSKAIYGGRVATIFSDTRISTLAATETTNAISNAENQVVNYANSRPRNEDDDYVPILFPYWITERDDDVCEICSPLNDRARSIWGGVFSVGPPGHPNCRCHIAWRPV